MRIGNWQLQMGYSEIGAGGCSASKRPSTALPGSVTRQHTTRNLAFYHTVERSDRRLPEGVRGFPEPSRTARTPVCIKCRGFRESRSTGFQPVSGEDSQDACSTYQPSPLWRNAVGPKIDCSCQRVSDYRARSAKEPKWGGVTSIN